MGDTPDRYIVHTVLFVVVLLSSSIRTSGTREIDEVKSLSKRELNWNDNNYIVSRKGHSNLKVNYFKSHGSNVGFDSSQNYLAFNIYKRNGQWLEPNAGIFHFVHSQDAISNKDKCSSSTLHSGAYYHVYGKCPQKEEGLVASGYCYWGNGKGLEYKSSTFNDYTVGKYFDGQYYLSDSRVANSHEQSLIQNCYNGWKNDGYPASYVCTLSELAGGMRGRRKAGNETRAADNVRVKRATVHNDCGCDCIPNGGESRSCVSSALRTYLALLVAFTVLL